jgi:two-component system cell cycle sensor histidine kinase/response regulator CckA
MSNWIGSGREEQRLDILRTILAIVTQGLMMHQTVSDLASMKSYNENIIESINTMGDMLIVFGYDGKIRRVNEATCNRLGYRERELKGKDIGIIFKKKDSILTDMKERQSIKNLEITFLTQRGESVFVLFSSTIMENSAGETEEIVGMARDITNIKETEKKYRSLFEEVKDVVFSADLNGQLLDINPAGLELLEFSSEKEALETNLKDTIFSEKTAYDTFCAKLKKDGYVRNYELSLMNRKGKEVNVILTANVIRNTAGTITAYRGIMKDITEQRALQRQLIQAQKMESIGTLAGGVAHDFNNIMTAILGYASIMKMNITDDHPFSNYLNTIESSANRAAQLTNQLLAFARAGKHNVKVFNINTIVKETVDLIKETFNRSINIESSLGEELPFIEGDANQIQQIIMNLCVNARDAMPDGGMLTVRTDAARITRRYVESHLGAKKGDYVRLTVSDTGVGIDERIIGRIFDPFFTTKGPGEGTGLGLSVVYGVVKNHGGYIDARSKLGEGSIFEIFFPVARGVRAEEKEEEREPPTGKHEMILIIDDEETVRSLAKEILEKYGYRTLLASDGEEGVALFRKNRSKVKLVIIDMIMPKLNGLETYQVITKIDPDAKAVLSTGYDHSERVKEILDSGVKGFIKKPYNVRELLSQVRNVLDS